MSEPPSREWIGFTIEAIGKAIENFGVSGFILVMVMAGVKLLANEATQDRFVRVVLFGDEGPALQIALGVLVVASITNAYQRRAAKGERDAELARVVQERDACQEKVLGAGLAHTDDPGGSEDEA